MSLSQAEINSIISVENSWLTTNCSIYRFNTALAPDGIGGFLEADSWELIETTVCDIWESQATSIETVALASQNMASNDWFITLSYDTDIKVQDVVVINSVAYDLIKIPVNQSINTALRCVATLRNEFPLV